MIAQVQPFVKYIITNRTIHYIGDLNRVEGDKWHNTEKEYRMPRDCFIRYTIECANSTSEPRYILAEDIFYYDPRAKKNMNSNKKRESIKKTIIEERGGALCQYIEDEFKIVIETPSHCKEYFEMEKGSCPVKIQDNGSCYKVCGK